MARPKGGRVGLDSLVNAVGTNSTVDPTAVVDGIYRSNVNVEQLAPNPRNPRESYGNLDDLHSIVERQLQPATAISRSAWLKLFPADNDAIGDAQFVIINGCRRLAAARKFGRPGLDMVIRDGLASDPATVLWASIAENLERQDFDVIEEAQAVAAMVAELGSAREAARRLNRTDGWVSQRRQLLELAPELQLKLRHGELAVRSARALAKVPLAEQVAAWEAAQRKRDQKDDPHRNDKPKPSNPVHTTEAVSRALRRLKAEPASVAAAIRDVWSPEDIDNLIQQLQHERHP